jgi:tRNA dimethylallyltransferase
MNGRCVVVIGGPTASGKTGLAVRLAESLQTEIISADSRQVFEELNIGVARPDLSELARVKHHFIADRSVQRTFNGGMYAKEANAVLSRLLEEKNVAIVCGGTGLYINALLYGLDELPEVDPELRASIERTFQDGGGLAALQEWLLKISPKAGEMVELSNPARVKRALELALASGKPLQEIWQRKAKPENYTVLGYYLEPPRDLLYKNINERSKNMFANGLVEEVRSMLPFRDLNALNSVGYKEVFDHFDGKSTLDACMALVQQHTRNYAKRQLTWFRNGTDFKSVHPDLAMDLIFDDLKKHGYPIHQ